MIKSIIVMYEMSCPRSQRTTIYLTCSIIDIEKFGDKFGLNKLHNTILDSSINTERKKFKNKGYTYLTTYFLEIDNNIIYTSGLS